MGNDWLQRISYQWPYTKHLLDQGFIALGWQRLSGSGILDVIRNEGEAGFRRESKQQKINDSRSHWNIWYFAQFAKDDRVVVPLPNGLFSVFQVLEATSPIRKAKKMGATAPSGTMWDGDGFLRDASSGDIIDLGFVVPVQPLKLDLARAKYADNALYASMKMFQANGNLNDISESITAALSGQSLSLYRASIDALSRELHRQISRVLNPSQFERLIKWYFLREGATHAYIPAKNAPGKLEFADADVIAIFDSLRTVYYIQAKMHKGETDAQAVQQIALYRQQRADEPNDDPDTQPHDAIAWVITNGESFTKKAKDLAAKHQVRLITGPEFAKALIDTGILRIDDNVLSDMA